MRVTEYSNLRWVDILKPTEEDIKFLEKNFDFHHLIIEEIRTPTYHPIIANYKTYLFWILHFPDSDPQTEQIQTMEVDFLITHNAVVTVRYQDYDDFDNALAAVREKPAYYMSKTTGHLLHYLVKELLGQIFPELDKVKEAIDRSEEHIFRKFDEELIEEVASINWQILDFLRAMKPQKSVWDAAPAIATEFWGERINPYISDIILDYNRVLHFVETHKEAADSLHDILSSLLDNKRNYVIKVLTIFTAIILPLSLVASIWGMNLNRLPLANNPLAFWLFLGGMLAVTAIMLWFFRHRKWI